VADATSEVIHAERRLPQATHQAIVSAKGYAKMLRVLILAIALTTFTVDGWFSAAATGLAESVGRGDVSPSEWRHYARDLQGTRYSPLDQIDGSNFNTLEVAWRFKTDNLGSQPEYKLEGTPLMVGGVLYATAGSRRAVVALDA
jgi:quinoprotein glucose dehydrogenase